MGEATTGAEGREDGVATGRGANWAALLVLLVAPALLFGPMVLQGRLFLPFLPVSTTPLAEEYPEAAEAAREGQQPILGDRVYPFLTDQIALREEVLAGRAPTWDPDLGLGMPLFGGTIAGPAYPPNALAVALPPEHAAAPLAALSLVLAGLGLWLFLRRLGLGAPAALSGALAFQLGTWGIANLFYPMKVDAALWFPWLLYGLEGLRLGRRGSGAVVSLTACASFLAGMVTVSAFVCAGAALYALGRALQERDLTERGPGPLARSAGFLLLGPALAALYLLPLAATGGASLRSPSDPTDLVDQSLPTTTLLGLVLPDPVGPPTDPTPSADLPLAWWMTPAAQGQRAENANVLEWNTHAGVWVVLLALVAVVATPRRALIPGALLLLVLGFAQGWPVVRWLYHLPGLGLGAPGRVLALAWCLWPWLAALGAQALVDRRKRALPTLVFASLVTGVVGLYFLVGHEPLDFGPALVERMVERYGEAGITEELVHRRLPDESMRAAGAHLGRSLQRLTAAALSALLVGLLLALETRGSKGLRGRGLLLVLLAGVLAFVPAAAATDAHGSRGFLVVASLTLLVLAILALRRLGGATPGRAWVLLLLPLCAEGMLGTHGHIHGRRHLLGEVFPKNPGVETIREATAGGRLLRFDGSADGLSEAAHLARPNLLAPYRIGDLTPYPSFTPKEPVELLRSLDPRFTQRNHVAPLRDEKLLGHPVLDLVRASAVLSARPLSHPSLLPRVELPGFHLYQRPSALGAVRVVPRAVRATTEEAGLEALTSGLVDFRAATLLQAGDHDRLGARDVPAEEFEEGRLSLTRPGRATVRIEVEGSSGGLLVLHEQWAEGWEAEIDGAQVPVVRADHVYRAVALPEGDSVVEFNYSPPSLRRGLLLSCAAALLLLAIELRALTRRA